MGALIQPVVDLIGLVCMVGVIPLIVIPVSLMLGALMYQIGNSIKEIGGF